MRGDFPRYCRQTLREAYLAVDEGVMVILMARATLD